MMAAGWLRSPISQAAHSALPNEPMLTTRPTFATARVLLCCIVVSAACGGEGTSAAPLRIEDQYVLDKIGDRAMPVLLISSPTRQFLWYDSLIVANGQATQIF